MLQVAFFKVFKRRIFRMSPIHHHFEMVGWAEPKIIVRFWILALIFASSPCRPEAAMSADRPDLGAGRRLAARAGLRPRGLRCGGGAV
jgi:hypothetical protein